MCEQFLFISLSVCLLGRQDIFFNNASIDLKSPFKLWQHLHGSWICYKSVISLISNKECASKRNVVNPVLCAVLTQRVFFVKTATLRYQSSSETQGQSVGAEKKARRKFSSRPVLENYQ